jgi:hypothetical protein
LAKSPHSETGYQAVLRTQAGVNERTAGNGARYADHRRRLMAAILDVAPPTETGRLCLLGAGNCNDVDLPALAQKFSEIHLVDLDAGAVKRAVEGQSAELRQRLTTRAPVDLSGLLKVVDDWRKGATLAQIEAAIAPAVQRIVTSVPGTFDVVASCCVLTQIGHGITTILGPTHGGLADAHQAGAVAHLRAMAGLLSPGGHGVFITDLVSSETYPLEELAPGRDFKELVADLVRDGNHFKGVNPLMLQRILRRDAILSKTIAPPRLIEPWLWRAVQARTFLVNGFAFQRLPPAA